MCGLILVLFGTPNSQNGCYSSLTYICSLNIADELLHVVSQTTLFVCIRIDPTSGVIKFCIKMVASVDEDTTDSLPDRNCSKEFYAKYEPKDVLGRYALDVCFPEFLC